MTHTIPAYGLTRPGVSTRSAETVPTISDPKSASRWFVHMFAASRDKSHETFVWSAAVKRLPKWSCLSIAQIVGAPDSTSSNMLKTGLFVTIHHLTASRHALRFTSRSHMNRRSARKPTGAVHGLAIAGSTAQSSARQMQMMSTSSCIAAAQSTMARSSPNRFMIRPDGVWSKKRVVLWISRDTMSSWIRLEMHIVTATVSWRHIRLTPRDPRPIASQAVA
mmetsp:Transcript_46369/g.134311  ORF Transcript_46369/g.134311 Transcript_46369/m.134311 type:complete len:221 (+) Transcript_46369:864-1526(+)